MARRVHDSTMDWGHILMGYGLDVGPGNDPLLIQNGSMEYLDLPDGGGDDATVHMGCGSQFDFVHGSQVLEHAIDPRVMLTSWIKITKPGGFIVATVPDWKLYEKETWPSKWNPGHKTVCTMDGGVACFDAIISGAEQIMILPAWLKQFDADVVLCRLVDTNYDYRAKPDIDQTYDFSKGVEAFIEFVLKKHANHSNP